MPAASFAGAGQLDPNFASSGLLNLPNKSVGAIAVQSDGKFITGRREFIAINQPSKFVLSRYNADGTIDNSFGNGEVTTDFGGGSNSITKIVVQPDGKIVAAGYSYISPNGGSVVLARYNADGTPDNSFHGDGKLNLPDLTIYLSEAPFVVVQSNGKIVIAATDAMIRLNTNGTLDNTFGISGKYAFTADQRIGGFAMQADDKLVGIGYRNNDFLITRFTADGALDNSFDGDGQATTDFGGNEMTSSVAIQSDGKIVVSGTSEVNSVSKTVLARYNSNGSPDNSFDGDGKVTSTLGAIGYPTLLLQADGKILLGGGNTEFSAARFNSNGSPDLGFDGDGVATQPANNHRNFGSVISGNRLLIVGSYYYSGLSVVAAFALENISVSGLNYRYFTGDFNTLPEFNSLVPASAGLSANVDISVRPAGTNDHFAFVWEGYINIQTPGTYTFETVSDDGSKFYFNSFYNPSATALITNDGLHAPQSATGSVTIPAAGLYPIAITYFEKDGGEAMQLYWKAPGGLRQLVPNALLSPKNPQVDHITPSTPSGLHLVYTGRTFARFDWQNSSDDVGVAGYQISVDGAVPFITSRSFATVENLAPGSYSYVQVRSIDSSGNLSFNSAGIFVRAASSGLKYTFYNNVRFGLVGLEGLSPAKGGSTNNLDVSVRPNGVNENYAFLWQGFINIPAPGTYTFETISDDGSKFYFNTPYKDNADPLINNFENNGLHAPVSVSKTIEIPSAGLYPVAIRYHQYGGGQTMQLYWQGPGLTRQLVPDAAFTNDTKPGFLTNPGLNYKYYEGTWNQLPDFTTLTPAQTAQSATIDISKRPSGRNDNFAFLWEGYITLPSNGEYTFETISDDGSKFYFNSKYTPGAIATVNNDGLHAATSVSTKVSVPLAGTYPISVTFFENNGDQKMELYWSGPGFTRELVPAEAFSTSPSNRINKVSYKTSRGIWSMLPDFNLITPAKTGFTNNIDLNKSKIEGTDDGYGVSWTGYVYLPAAGNYTFETVSDDGSKLYFDNLYWNTGTVALVNNDGVHASQSATGTVTVNTAGVYPIVVNYFEQYEGQSIDVYWTGPGIPRQKIPDESFVYVESPTFPTEFYYDQVIVTNNEITSSAIAGQEATRRSVYPNPFNNNITIDFYNDYASNNISIGLYDMNGRKVYVNNAGKLPAGNNVVKLNLAGANIKEGVYFVQIQKNGITWKTTKVVKMKK